MKSNLFFIIQFVTEQTSLFMFFLIAVDDIKVVTCRIIGAKFSQWVMRPDGNGTLVACIHKSKAECGVEMVPRVGLYGGPSALSNRFQSLRNRQLCSSPSYNVLLLLVWLKDATQCQIARNNKNDMLYLLNF